MLVTFLFINVDVHHQDVRYLEQLYDQVQQLRVILLNRSIQLNLTSLVKLLHLQLVVRSAVKHPQHNQIWNIYFLFMLILSEDLVSEDRSHETALDNDISEGVMVCE